MALEGKPNIVVRKVKKQVHGHHGGAWKVAYADFVTAMMAFFLLLWLLNAVTEEQLHGVADYFAPIAASTNSKGTGKPLDGGQPAPSVVTMPIPQLTFAPDNPEDIDQVEEPVDEASYEKLMAQREQRQFEQAKEILEDAIEEAATKLPDLAKLKDHLLVDMTPEGLRIQLVDDEGLALFPSGSASMHQHTSEMLAVIGELVKKMPQQVSITGHTDAVPFRNDKGTYSNWELSADRALASRRVLMAAGVPEPQIAKVVGKAATDPLVEQNPFHERNRRISIVLLREHDFAPPDQTETISR